MDGGGLPLGFGLEAMDDAQIDALRKATVEEAAAWLGFSEEGAAMVLATIRGSEFDRG